MRVFFILLLIALTPLRGWANDMMATRMASQQSLAVHAAATEARSHCEDMAALEDAAGPAAPETHNTHCNNCSLCQVCFAPALPLAILTAPHAVAGHAPPTLQAVPFRSATLSLGQKPPIS
jgi:hypothetical protein